MRPFESEELLCRQWLHFTAGRPHVMSSPGWADRLHTSLARIHIKTNAISLGPQCPKDSGALKLEEPHNVHMNCHREGGGGTA